MNSTFDYLLIGNTRLHWAEKIGENYQFNHSLLHQPLPENLNIEKLLWASVGNYQTNVFRKDKELKTKDINLKNFPPNFGIDRTLGCFGALKFTKNPNKKDIVIADFGTTLSITKINSEGNLIGGQLIPGFITQLKAMTENTKNLEMPINLKIPQDNFLIDSKKAMIKGVVNCLLGAVRLAFNPRKDILILCGGDCEIIKPNFPSELEDIIIRPNLVMEGMIMFHQKY
tara:strand:+ start:12372 stop:13055 length:684 start_codon:yes stop_codon:yes gene_type:complete